jgi:DNA-binding GntR family transcriptional regulator
MVSYRIAVAAVEPPMSPEALTADRVYRDLKRTIMLGRYKPGGSITVTAVADEFATSISPVRDALERMVGERIVDTQTGGGFLVPMLTRSATYNLYSWHADIVRLAVKAMAKGEAIGPFPGIQAEEELGRQVLLADLTADFFERVGACSNNAEHHAAIVSAGARLHTLRLRESLLPRLEQELETLWNVTMAGNKNDIRLAMWHYHRRRLSKAKALTNAAGGSAGNGNGH